MSECLTTTYLPTLTGPGTAARVLRRAAWKAPARAGVGPDCHRDFVGKCARYQGARLKKGLSERAERRALVTTVAADGGSAGRNVACSQSVFLRVNNASRTQLHNLSSAWWLVRRALVRSAPRFRRQGEVASHLTSLSTVRGQLVPSCETPICLGWLLQAAVPRMLTTLAKAMEQQRCPIPRPYAHALPSVATVVEPPKCDRDLNACCRCV